VLNPWTVTDPRERTSVQQILSPFLVMEKMLMLMPGQTSFERATACCAKLRLDAQTFCLFKVFPSKLLS